MKITLTESEFINRFLAIRPENFSRKALEALFAHYDEIEASTGEELEFDPIAICCDWTEYETCVEAAESYGWTRSERDDDEEAESKASQWLSEESVCLLIEGSQRCVVLNF